LGHGAGLVIPLETVARVSSSLLRHGKVRRGFLGISSQPVALPQALRDRLGLSQESALMVVGVESGGPSERAGLLMGDVLIGLHGQPIRDTDDLRGLLSSERVGEATTARVIRGGEARDLTVTIGER